MSKYDELANAAMYAASKDDVASIWLEAIEDGIRVRGVGNGKNAERAVAWVNLEHYRNGAQALLEKTIDEVFAMLAERPDAEQG